MRAAQELAQFLSVGPVGRVRPDPTELTRGPLDVPVPLTEAAEAYYRQVGDGQSPVRGPALQVGDRVVIVQDLETLLGHGRRVMLVDADGNPISQANPLPVVGGSEVSVPTAGDFTLSGDVELTLNVNNSVALDSEIPTQPSGGLIRAVKLNLGIAYATGAIGTEVILENTSQEFWSGIVTTNAQGAGVWALGRFNAYDPDRLMASIPLQTRWMKATDWDTLKLQFRMGQKGTIPGDVTWDWRVDFETWGVPSPTYQPTRLGWETPTGDDG